MSDYEKLKSIIDEVDVLISHRVSRDDSEFQQWHKKTKRFLFNHYGSDSIEYSEFDKIRFTLQIFGFETSKMEFVQKCKKDLITAKEILQDYLNDLSENNISVSNNSNLEQEIELIFSRFRKVAVQLSRRYNARETIRITDEYDVQDLLRSLLSLYFDDIRTEEWTPSYAGSSLRIDFLIPEIEAVIEVKKTRESMNDKKLSEELIVDIEKYQSHPKCKKIYCFVYDPDTILRNPVAIKKDLEEKHPGLVKVFIES